MKKQHAGQRGGVLDRRAGNAERHLAIDEHGENDAVNDGERRDLGWRCEPEENPGKQHAGHQAVAESRRSPARATTRSGRARSGRRAGATGADSDERHEAERNDRRRHEARR